MPIALSPNDVHNRDLLENTHPGNWRNPEPDNPYNLVVVGAGTAGLVAAAGAAGLGARVALIERHLMGGDCLNYGCVPSKGLIRSATAVADSRSTAEFGVRTAGEAEVDFAKVMERMRKLRARISKNDSVSRFTDLGIDVFLGEARFLDDRQVEVQGARVAFSRAVIATGARAAAPPIPRLEEAGYLNNETLFNLTERPESMVIIGAGPIGCEMAQTFQRLGTSVTLVELADHILIKEDADAAAVVQDQLLRDGVTLALEAEKITGVETQEGKKVVRYFCRRTRGECAVTCDVILVAAGRAPNVDGLGLEEAGVAYDPRRGITVNDRLRTTNPRVYAAGDVASRYQFTHAADFFLARTVIANALFMSRQKASALTIPWCTYTDPQIAHVGITEHQAREDGIAIDTYTQPLEDVDRAILDGETNGFVKIHTGKGTGRILGATIVARHAGDMMGEIVMAMTNGIGLGSVAKVIHPYPTQAEAIRRVGDLYNRTRLTPGIKRLMARWMRFQRGR